MTNKGPQTSADAEQAGALTIGRAFDMRMSGNGPRCCVLQWCLDAQAILTGIYFELGALRLCARHFAFPVFLECGSKFYWYLHGIVDVSTNTQRAVEGNNNSRGSSSNVNLIVSFTNLFLTNPTTAGRRDGERKQQLLFPRKYYYVAHSRNTMPNGTSNPAIQKSNRKSNSAIQKAQNK